jgi:hypothetical protein
MGRRLPAWHLVAVFSLFIACAQSFRSGPPTSLCELKDGDCGDCPAGEGKVNLTPLVHINDACAHGLCQVGAKNRSFTQAADAADDVIKLVDNSSSGGKSNIIRFDSTTTGLHTSVLYVCCQRILDAGKTVDAFKRMWWRSFDVAYATAGCNVDQHGSDVIYIHALPDAAGQAQLKNLTQTMNAAMAAAGVPVHHPRASLFHMTLARVTQAYDTDKAVATLREMANATATPLFGTLRMCRFKFAGITFEASDGCKPFDRV